MALSYNLGYQEIISVHPTRRQIFAGKTDSTFPNIWQWVIYTVGWWSIFGGCQIVVVCCFYQHLIPLIHREIVLLPWWSMLLLILKVNLMIVTTRLNRSPRTSLMPISSFPKLAKMMHNDCDNPGHRLHYHPHLLHDNEPLSEPRTDPGLHEACHCLRLQLLDGPICGKAEIRLSRKRWRTLEKIQIQGPAKEMK